MNTGYEDSSIAYPQLMYSFVQSACDAMVITDSKMKIAWCNQAAERIFDYAIGELTGKEMSRILLFNLLRCPNEFKAEGLKKISLRWIYPPGAIANSFSRRLPFFSRVYFQQAVASTTAKRMAR